MSGTNLSRKVVSVGEQAFEQADEQAVDEDGFPVVDETPAFEATVEEETQAKVGANHPDGIADTSSERIHGVTLEQEERIQVRGSELERISAQAELGTQDGREQRTREVVSELCGRDEPKSVEPHGPPREADARGTRGGEQTGDADQPRSAGRLGESGRREAVGRAGAARSGHHEGGVRAGRRTEDNAGSSRAHCGCAGHRGR